MSFDAGVFRFLEVMFLRFRQEPIPAVQTAVEELRPIRNITNADLTEADIPGDDAQWTEWPGLCAFAASFSGYQYWGSLKRCGEVASLEHTRHLRDLTLTELRTCFFWLYRDIHHQGWPRANDHERARALLAEIRDRVRRGRND